MNFSSLPQKGTWISSKRCQMLELGAIVSRVSRAVVCIAQPRTYSPILASLLLAWDSENCPSPLPVDLVSQQGVSEARGRRGMGDGTSCLLTVPVIVTAPTAVFCAVLVAAEAHSHFQLLSKLASQQHLAAPPAWRPVSLAGEVLSLSF